MKYHELNAPKHRPAKRVGRGIAAGQGKTAGRGTKGQKSRTGSSRKPGFTGGQNPIMQALPKLPGFKSHRIKPEIIYTSQLDSLAGKTIDTAALAGAGLLSSPYVTAKLLVKGEVSKKATVKLPAASAAAIAQIEKAGGSFEQVPRLQRPKTSAERADRRRAPKPAA